MSKLLTFLSTILIYSNVAIMSIFYYVKALMSNYIYRYDDQIKSRLNINFNIFSCLLTKSNVNVHDKHTKKHCSELETSIYKYYHISAITVYCKVCVCAAYLYELEQTQKLILHSGPFLTFDFKHERIRRILLLIRSIQVN